MYFGLSEEQEFFQESLLKYLNDAAPVESIREYANGNHENLTQDIHQGLLDLGVNALIIPEDFGGLGLDFLFAAAVSQSLGSGIAPATYIGSHIMAPLAIMEAGSGDQKDEYLSAMANSKMRFGIGITEFIGAREDAGIVLESGKASGRTLFVIDGAGATHYLLSDNKGVLFVVDAKDSGITKIPLMTIDKTRTSLELVLEDVPTEILKGSVEDQDPIKKIIDAGRVMIAADSLGAAQVMIDKSVEYAKERKQFGRPVGSFQAVKHMCAQMAADLEPCYSMVWYSAHCQNHIPEEARLFACHTKAHVSEVATSIAKTATEVHGGMGFTDLLGLHYWFKRIGINRQLLGGPELIREEAAQLQNF